MDYAKMVGMQNDGAAGIGNLGAAQNALTQPKELGALQRVDGLRTGLQELRGRLERFFDRIDGNSGEKAANQAPVAASLSGTLSDAETELRTCLHMIDTLHDRF